MIAASIIPGTCLLGVCFADCNSTIVVGLMILATCCYGSMFAGVFSNHTDIASNYAGKYYIDTVTSCNSGILNRGNSCNRGDFM